MHLRHLCKRIQFGILQNIGHFNPVNGYDILLRKSGNPNKNATAFCPLPKKGTDMQDDKRPLILTIDDEMVIREVFRNYLEDYNYRVISAEGGHQGLDIIENQQPDLVLLDLRMPEMDGLDVLSRVAEKHPDLPLIIVSGTGVISDAIHAIHLGAWDYLLKPVEDMTVLLHAVEKALERSKLIRENRKFQEQLQQQVKKRTQDLERANAELSQINSRLRKIVETTKDLSVEYKLSGFGSKLLEEFGRHMMATGGSLYILTDGGLTLAHALDPGHAPDFIAFPLPKGSVFERTLSEKKPVLIKAIDKEADINASGWTGYSDTSVLTFPLPDESGEIVGILSLHSKTAPPFMKQDKEIGSVLASYSCEALRAAKVAEELQKSELRYRALFENSPVALWEEDFSLLKQHLEKIEEQGISDFNAYFTLNPDQVRKCIKMIRITDVNHATLKLYEARTKDQLYGSLDKILFRDAHALLKNEILAVADGKMFKMESENQTLSGRKLHVQIKSSIPPGFEKSWEKVYISVVDFTERVEAEKRQEVLEAQLRQAQKMESIGTLAGGIAHDFNNILSSVIGYTELTLQDLAEGSLAKNRLKAVLKAGNRAKALVRQILTFSRQSEQVHMPVQLHLVIKEALKLLRSSLPATIEIKQNILSNDWILADPTQMHQVAMNICTNAFHAMEDKGGVMEVELKTVEADEIIQDGHPDIVYAPHMVLTVKDTGRGMSRRVLERIFDPYFTTKKKGKGTGLGLSVVHGIVKGHGGEVFADSDGVSGSVFKVMLPVVKGADKEKVRHEEVIPQGYEKILLVDDEKEIVSIEKEILQRLGYRVTAFTSSLEALEDLSNDPSKYDLVISDLTMPNMTGDKLAEKLIKIRPDLPVMLCTGFSEYVSEETSEQFGIKKLVMKPVSIKEMALAIREILDA